MKFETLVTVIYGVGAKMAAEPAAMQVAKAELHAAKAGVAAMTAPKAKIRISTLKFTFLKICFSNF